MATGAFVAIVVQVHCSSCSTSVRRECERSYGQVPTPPTAPNPNQDHGKVALGLLLLLPYLALAAGELLAGIPAGQCRSPPLISARDLFVILKYDFRV